MEEIELFSRFLMQELSDGPGWLTGEECTEAAKKLKQKRNFAVICCEIDVLQGEQCCRESRKNLIRSAEQVAGEWDLQLLAFWHLQSDMFLVLQGDGMNRRTLRSCMEELNGILEGAAIVTLCAGEPCDTLEKLCGQGHMVATMTDYAALTSRRLFFMEELPEVHYDLSCEVLKGRLEQNYMEAVVRKDFEAACSCLERIVQQELDEDIRSVRRLKTRLMAKVETAMQVSGIFVDAPGTAPEIRELFTRTTGSPDLQGLLTGIREIYALLERMHSQETDRKERSPRMVLDYLDQHFSDPCLDSTMVAEACGVSKSYVSRVVNQHGGSSFSDYVNALRIGAAKELLRSSESHVDEISQWVGFTNRWTMLRAFHRFVGMTPQEYRSYSAGIVTAGKPEPALQQ